MTPLGSRWRQIPPIIRLLLLPNTTPTLQTCPTCSATWHDEYPDCEWCTRRQQAQHDWILQPPNPRGYGYATPTDLAHLHIDPDTDRQTDLEHWRHDLELAVDAQLITQAEGEAAWQSATKAPKPSTSSTGQASTTAPTPTTTPSSTASPTAGAGRQSPQRRKQANRPSSLPSRWQPPKQAT